MQKRMRNHTTNFYSTFSLVCDAFLRSLTNLPSAQEERPALLYIMVSMHGRQKADPTEQSLPALNQHQHRPEGRYPTVLVSPVRGWLHQAADKSRLQNDLRMKHLSILQVPLANMSRGLPQGDPPPS